MTLVRTITISADEFVSFFEGRDQPEIVRAIEQADPGVINDWILTIEERCYEALTEGFFDMAEDLESPAD